MTAPDPKDELVTHLPALRAFALSLTPDDPALLARMDDVAAKRAAGLPQAVVALSIEWATNPFLRAADPAYRAAVGLSDMTAAQAFAELRGRKDRF